MTLNKTTEEIIRFDNVSLKYEKDFILQNISFSLQKGSFHYLTGESGSGKTSLLKLIYFANDKYYGNIKLFQKNIKIISKKERPLFRQKIGVVFQDFNLLDHLSALDNVTLSLRIKQAPQKKCISLAKELLDWVGLGDHIDSTPKQLSGGQKQRVVIARAVIAKPDILLADEPTGNVDDKTAVNLLELFEKLNKLGTTIVIATHNRDLVTEFSYPEIHIENKSIQIFESLKVINLESVRSNN